MMGKLLKFELRKVFRGKSIYICTAVSVFLVLIVALTSKFLSSETNVTLTTGALMKSCLGDMNVVLLSAIFTTVYVCEDFSLGTIKNIYGKGYTRNQLYFSKYIVSLISTLIMSAACLLICYLFGVIFTNHDASLGKDVIISILLQLFLMLSYTSLYYFVSMSIGKLGICLAINIIAPTFLSLFLTLIDSLTKWEKFHFSDYWLTNMLSAIKVSEVQNKYLWIASIGGLIYIAITVVAGFFINRKREIK